MVVVHRSADTQLDGNQLAVPWDLILPISGMKGAKLSETPNYVIAVTFPMDLLCTVVGQVGFCSSFLLAMCCVESSVHQYIVTV